MLFNAIVFDKTMLFIYCFVKVLMVWKINSHFWYQRIHTWTLFLGIHVDDLFQAQFSQMRPMVMPPSVAPRMPMYPPGVPGVGQQLFYGQPPPAFVNPQVHQYMNSIYLINELWMFMRSSTYTVKEFSNQYVAVGLE